MLDDIKNSLFSLIALVIALLLLIAIPIGICVKVIFDLIRNYILRRNREKQENKTRA